MVINTRMTSTTPQYSLWDVFLKVLLAVCGILTFNLTSSQLMVNVSGGQLLGKWTTFSNGSVVSFLGIPYAHAPVNDRRFTSPVGGVTWSGVRNATELSAVCLQSENHFYPLHLEMSEDCLYLNIYVPEIRPHHVKKSPNFTVVVYFHPGGFQFGSGAMLDGKSMALEDDVIVVTVNFRLGLFGFLSLDKTYSGNYGLYDQVAALKWVKNNIQKFGGNPNNIILLCEHFTARLHLLSSFAGQFHRLVSYKGGGLQIVGDIGRSKKFTNNITFRKHCRTHLGLHDNNDNIDINRCIQSMDAKDLLKMSTGIISPWKQDTFGPVIDGVFLMNSPRELLHDRKYQHADYMMLNIKHDLDIFRTRRNQSSALPHRKNCSYSMLKDIAHLISQSHTLSVSLTQLANMVQKVLESFYFPESTTYNSFCSVLNQLISDFSLSELLSFSDIYSATKFTFLAVTNDNGETNESSRSQDFYCVLQPGICNTSLRHFNSLIKSYFTYGYPHVSSGDPWRPYTKSNHNFLLIENNTLKTGDMSIWPYRKMEMLWRDLIPQLDTENFSKLTNSQQVKNRRGVTLQSYSKVEWGMAQSQLEAFMLSLILVVLFLLMVTLTLFRIICHVKGKPFYDIKLSPNSSRGTNCVTQPTGTTTRNAQEQFTESSGISSISEF